MLCRCGWHQKSVHLTSSDPDYRRHLLGQLRRATCWDEEKPQWRLITAIDVNQIQV